MSILLAALQRNASLSSSNVSLRDIRLGSVIRIRGGFGLDAPETVTIDCVEADGKNGRATIGYTDNNGDGRWAYLDQIQKVITY